MIKTTEGVPPVSMNQTMLLLRKSTMSQLVRIAARLVANPDLTAQLPMFSDAATEMLEYMPTIPPPATFLNIVGGHTDADRWDRVRNVGPKSAWGASCAPSPSKRRKRAASTTFGRDVPRVPSHVPVHSHAKTEVMRMWDDGQPLITCSDVFAASEMMFLLRLHSNYVLDAGRIWLRPDTVLVRAVLLRMLTKYLLYAVPPRPRPRPGLGVAGGTMLTRSRSRDRSICTKPAFVAYMDALAEWEATSATSSLSATDRYVKKVTSAAQKRRRDAILAADVTWDTAPRCIKNAVDDGIDHVNFVRMQLGAAIAAAARALDLDPHILAEPVYAKMKASKANRHRVYEFRKWVSHGYKNPMDTRLCCTREGLEYRYEKVVCPFKGVGGVETCLRERGVDPTKTAIPLGMFTISRVWITGPDGGSK